MRRSIAHPSCRSFTFSATCAGTCLSALHVRNERGRESCTRNPTQEVIDDPRGLERDRGDVADVDLWLVERLADGRRRRRDVGYDEHRECRGCAGHRGGHAFLVTLELA